jgi:hypothetical protein
VLIPGPSPYEGAARHRAQPRCCCTSYTSTHTE